MNRKATTVKYFNTFIIFSVTHTNPESVPSEPPKAVSLCCLNSLFHLIIWYAYIKVHWKLKLNLNEGFFTPHKASKPFLNKKLLIITKVSNKLGLHFSFGKEIYENKYLINFILLVKTNRFK